MNIRGAGTAPSTQPQSLVHLISVNTTNSKSAWKGRLRNNSRVLRHGPREMWTQSDKEVDFYKKTSPLHLLSQAYFPLLSSMVDVGVGRPMRGSLLTTGLSSLFFLRHCKPTICIPPPTLLGWQHVQVCSSTKGCYQCEGRLAWESFSLGHWV